MSLMITEECINCGACEPECPNTAIYSAGMQWTLGGQKHDALSNDFFYITWEKCTECKGFHDEPQCSSVCPVGCCVPDPSHVETEAELLAKKERLDAIGR